MLCTRCSHPLKPRADRCVRCFALTPQNGAQPPPPTAGRPDSRRDGPPASAYRVSDDLTGAGLDSLAGARARRAAPGPQLGLSFPQGAAQPSLDAVAAPKTAHRGVRLRLPSYGARLVSWAADAGLGPAGAALPVAG